MKKKIILTVLLLLAVFYSNAQSKAISGIVIAAEGFPIPGVAIVLNSSTTGTTTDFDGSYTISAKENDVLVFTALGYETVTLIIGADNNYNVTLKESIAKLDEIVLVGYSSKRKSDLTGSVASVKVEDLQENSNAVNFDQALQGLVSGVQVSSVDGTPGERTRIVIRGGNSITGDNSPLYVVDGIPLEDFDPASISSDDILRFDVQKDAASTAIYGSRGSNGVIIIETKSGKTDGKTDVKIGVSSGVQVIPNRLPVMSPYEYVLYQQRVATALDNYTQGTNTRFFVDRWTDPELYRNTEGISWQDEIFREAYTNKLNLSVSGGTEKTNIYLSSELLNQEGTLINTNFKKSLYNLKISHKLSKKTKLGANLRYSLADREGLRVSGDRDVSVIRDALRSIPLDIPGVTGVFDVINQDPALSQFNTPTNELNGTDRRDRSEVFNGNIVLEHKFTKDLRFKTYNTFRVDNRRFSIFQDSRTNSGIRGVNGINGRIQNRRFENLSTSNVLSYRKKLGASRISSLAGIEFQKRSVQSAQLRSNQIPTDVFGINNLQLGLEPGVPITGLGENTLLSFFGKAEYIYSDKYFFEGTMRADGSSKFRNDNRWGYFPSVGVAWKASRENFLSNVDAIDLLKFRFSWGLSGNNRIGDFDFLSQLNINNGSGYVFGEDQSFVPGTFQSNLGDPNLTWETTETIDAGIDMNLFNNRIEVIADVYIKRTSDLLLFGEAALHTGFDRIQQNIGETENKGLEVTLNTVNISTPKFKWETSFNIAFNRNKAIALSSGLDAIFTDPQYFREIRETQYITRVGEPVGQIYGLRYERLYQADDFIIDGVTGEFTLKPGIPDNGNTVAPGSVKFIDQNGDGTINVDDRVVIGNPQPKHTGGITNKFTVGNFSLQFLMQWSYGNDVLNANKLVLGTPNPSALSGFRNLLNAWTPTNTDTDVSTIRYQGVFGIPPVGNQLDDRFIEDGSYIRLRSLSFAYKLPKLALKKLKFKEVRFNITAQNIFTWTNYSGYNPDVSVGRFGALTPGLDYSAYPQSISITTGLNITL